MNHLSFLQLLSKIPAACDVQEALVDVLDAFQHVVQGEYYSAYFGTEGLVYLPDKGWMGPGSDFVSKIALHSHEHPFCRDFFALKIPRAYLRSAMVPDPEWHRTKIYRELDSAWGIEDMIGLYFTMTGGLFGAVHCGRGHTFSASEFAAAQSFHLLAAPLLRHPPEPRAPKGLSAELTIREADVIRWVSEGKSNAEIAEILKISHHTVRKHLESILPKLGAENRTGAAREWVQRWQEASPPL